MEENIGNRIYKSIMIIIITAIITFMITSIGMYNYFIKTEDGNIALLTKHIEISGDTATLEEKLELTKKELEKYYIGDLNTKEMEEMAIKGYVAGVDDEYTEYLTKEEYEELTISVTGDYVGIGIYMAMNKEGKVEVVLPMEDSPAIEAGLQAGDIILSVNGEECTGTDLTVTSNKIKGEAGTSVELEILRGEEKFKKIITRRKVEIKNSSSKVLDGNIGYIVLKTFDENCTEKVNKYLADFQKQGINSVIIDLRDNTGGMVQEAISFSELFVKKGDIIMRSYNKEEKETITKSNANATYNMKVVLLVNGYSASATEIVTGALKDNKIATIVGTKTFGKGVMQEVHKFLTGAIKVTIQEFKTPNGNKIQKLGIEPNIVVEDNEATEEDEQLEKAIEILK